MQLGVEMLMIKYFKQSSFLSSCSHGKIRDSKSVNLDFVKVVLLADLLVIKLAVLSWWYLLSNQVAARVHHPIAGLAASKILLFALKTDQY